MTREFQQILNTSRDIIGFRATMKMLFADILSRPPKDKFDKRYNVSTQDVMSHKDLGLTSQYSVDYVPIHERVINHVLNNLNISYEDYIFIDLGCGKGRAILAAMLFPFKKIIGVELIEFTSKIATDNVEILKKNKLVKCTDIEICCQDAINFDIPNDNITFFLFMPFVGPILDQVLDKICRFREENNKRVIIAHAELRPSDEKIFLSKDRIKKIHDYRTLHLGFSWSLWELQ